MRRERWGGWRCLPPLDSSGHLCVSDHQKLEREARICRLLKHPNIGEHGGWARGVGGAWPSSPACPGGCLLREGGSCSLLGDGSK